ncbi:MAG: alpha/beta hydrolase family protein [Stenotrophobium sp.]
MSADNVAWWDALSADFYRQSDHTELDARYPLRVRGTAAADRVLRTGLGSLMVGAMARHLALPWDMRRQRQLLQFYHSYADRGDADAVFLAPSRDHQVHESAPRWRGYRPRGIPARLLQFESKFQTLNPQMREVYARHRRNRQASALHFRHPGGPRPTLIFLHGFMADPFFANTWGFSLKWLYRRGYDVLLVTEPFHGYRRGLTQPFSGFGFFAGGFSQANEAMLHAVHDVRVYMDYLQAQGVSSMGVSGYSLGGYIATMLANADARLAFCIPNSPVVAPIDMALEWQPIRPLLLAAMKIYGLSIQELRHGLALHSPLSYTPKLAPERLLVIGGAGDRLTSPRFVNLLHEHWRGSSLHWFPGNHLLHFQQRHYLRLMQRFMDLHSA